MGAKKSAAPINFAEAERKAVEEAERIKQLGYDREKEKAEEEERVKKQAESLKSAPVVDTKVTGGGGGGSARSTPVDTKPKGSAHDLERLGMGMKRLGFGAVPTATSPSSARCVALLLARSLCCVFSSSWAAYSAAQEDATTYARDKFGNQKAISSDMYFGRNAYDPVAQGEAQNRLQSFQGASSISSNQYFGRDEEDELAGGGLGNAGGSDGGYGGDGTLAGVEMAARDALQRVLANPDVQNAADSIRAGALKVWF